MKTTKIKQIIKITFFIFFFSANFSFAQDATENFKQTADNLTNNVLTSVGTLLMTAAFLFFFYGVVVFILGRVSGKGDMAKLEQGKQFMLWGLIALFVMVSVWGIVRLAQDMLGVKGSDIQIKPVQFTPMAGGGNRGGDNLANINPVGGGTPAPAENKKFTKSEGASCIGLPGADSECIKGMFCRRSDNTTVKAGEAGTCQKVDLNLKFKKLIDYAQTKILNNSQKKVGIENDVLYIRGQVIAKIDYDELWRLFQEVDPEFRSSVVMSVTVY